MSSQSSKDHRPKKKKRFSAAALMTPTEAAYSLFDWVEYGDEYVFDLIEKFAANKKKEDCSSEGSGNEIGDNALMEEEDFKPETEENSAPKWTENVLGQACTNTMSLREESDPVGMK